jgi:septum formation protein
MNKRVILASQSPARHQLLSIIGIKDILVIPADIDETELPGEKPKNLAKRLSISKAQKIFTEQIYTNDLRHNYWQDNQGILLGDIIIAADSVITLDNIMLPKALNDEDVKYCLTILSGRTHVGYTGVCMIDIKSQTTLTKVVKSQVTFSEITAKEIDWYIKTKEGLNKAGGYTLCGAIQVFCTKISGQISTIIGLPLHETKNMLEDLGYKF